jgi:hypothetical protein
LSSFAVVAAVGADNYDRLRIFPKSCTISKKSYPSNLNLIKEYYIIVKLRFAGWYLAGCVRDHIQVSFKRGSTMASIREVVQQALAMGCLTLEAEEQLRQLLRTKYAIEDFRAFMKLQHAVFSGIVRQESRERASCHQEMAHTS